MTVSEQEDLQRDSTYRQAVDQVAAAFETDVRRGLSGQDARARLDRHGPNVLASEPPVPRWRRFLAQFEDVLVLLLLVATVISAAMWLYTRDTALPYEAIAIFAVVVLNATMGYLQETRAESAVAALRRMSAADATVMRGGERMKVPAAILVPGDIMLIEEGDTIPADGRLTESAALQTAEAALTGESLPVEKDTAAIAETAALGDRHNMIFSGTAATYGHGTAIVTATGMRTEVGRIAGLLKETRAEITPLQRELDRTGKRLGVIVIVIAIVMIATIMIIEDVRGITATLDVLILGGAGRRRRCPRRIAGLAALGPSAQRMAQRTPLSAPGAVRHSARRERSSDAGTLTKNEMTVRVVVTASGRATFEGTGSAPEGAVRGQDGGPIDGLVKVELERALAAADRANNAAIRQRDGQWTVQGDPTEGALLVAARKAGLGTDALEAHFPRVGEVPFSSERKLMTDPS
jgi:Ca2+-transporting ATPase